MYYCATRDENIRKSASQALLEGMAADGGLYVMPELPRLSAKEALSMDACGISAAVISALIPDIPAGRIGEAVRHAYEGRFETQDITPTVKVGDKWVLELFRGPTCAFKDVALCVLPHLLASARAQNSVAEDIMILTATSGDTGKAALSGFADVDGMKIAVFYPDGGVSAIQRAQMVTQQGRNVAVCAVRGNFDDAQTGVKAIFAKAAAEPRCVPAGVRLSSANSINIGRLAPQVMYYYKAYCDIVRAGGISCGDKVDFSVPTGNFGDILAGWIARGMGLPVGELICASNANDVLTEFLNTGVYDRRRPFYRTASPSMDILVSSNLERLLYYESDGDCAKVSGYMRALAKEGRYAIDADMLGRIRAVFRADSSNDEEGFGAIARVFKTYGYLMDTHTAAAWRAAEKLQGRRPCVVLSTASPFKFAQSVLFALTGVQESDGFAAMDELARVSGLAVPSPLASLRFARELHTDVINKEDMCAYAMEKAASI